MEKKIKKEETSAAPEEPKFIPWISATQEQKIDRLHFVVKDLIKAMNAVQRKADKTEAKLFNHKHVGDQLMQIMNQFEAPEKEEKDTRKPEEIWF